MTGTVPMPEEPILSAPKPTPEQLIDGAKLQRRVYKLSLAGHLVPKLQQLDQELAELNAAYNPDAPRRIGGRPEKDVKADEIEALQVEMDEQSIDVILEQQPRDVFRDFQAAHPPRDGNKEDERAGIDFAAVEDEWLRMCVVEPNLSEERWQRLMSTAAPGDIHDMAVVAYNMHTLALNIPKSRNVFVARRMNVGD